MTVLLVAHGTRNPHGVALIGDLAAAMRDRLAEHVAVSFVDVLGPSPSEALAGQGPDPVTVVPAFLGRGYHVRRDLPEYLGRRGVPPTRVTDSLGPSCEVIAALADRLHRAGRRAGDAVVLAAAGSSDPTSHQDVESVAAALALVLGAPVEVAFAAPSAKAPQYPAVSDAVARLRRRHARVSVASHLLAPGLFQTRLEHSGADVVAAPLGLHPLIVERACALARCTVPVAG
ncbi:sirohydrochlorin chelatase [Gordonia sp. HY442]|uniref:sirohydrochlorin chelatase n=1 Tax=Gordonia zhenghanii TaxID=2911516 RepID=UPI001F36238A|nr:CbiX/SirB N-terminal domain-containing protein [Gordonia zhenghanii]MCF8603352.1 sirohydrochlorin chelatase [Gordonia zhenghanii]